MKQETLNELMAVCDRVKEQEPENYIVLFYGDGDRAYCAIKGPTEDIVAALIKAGNRKEAIKEIISRANRGIKNLEKNGILL